MVKVKEASVRLKLAELYAQYGISQSKVSELTGIRTASLSGLKNNFRTAFDVKILQKLIVFFEIENLEDLIEVKYSTVDVPKKDAHLTISQYLATLEKEAK